MFLDLCADVRSYEADEMIRDNSSRLAIAAIAAGDEASSKDHAKVLKDLCRIRIRPLL